MMKLVTNIVLTIIVIVLGYFLIRILSEPIKLKQEQKIKKEAIIRKLENIRSAQFAYKSVKNKFADNWDSLIKTIRDEEFTVIKTIGDPNEEDSIKLAQITRDTLHIPILDSIFSSNYDIDSIKYIPFTKGSIFNLEAGSINQRGVDVHVFEVIDSDPFDPENVIILGSMLEVNYNGNWK